MTIFGAGSLPKRGSLSYELSLKADFPLPTTIACGINYIKTTRQREVINDNITQYQYKHA